MPNLRLLLGLLVAINFVDTSSVGNNFSLKLLTASLPPNVTECNINKVDNCAKKLFLWSDNGFVHPKNSGQAKIFCKEMSEALDCVKNFSRMCTKPFTRQYTSLFLSGPVKSWTRYCASPQQMAKFVASERCSMKAKRGLHDCHQALLIDGLRILRMGTASDVIPAACCVLSRVRQCSIKVVMSNVCSNFPQEQRQFIISLLNDFLGDSDRKLCNSQFKWGTELCTDIEDELPPHKHIQKKPSSIYVLALEGMYKFLEQ